MATKKGLSRVEQRNLLNEIRKYLGKNFSDHEICSKLDLRLDLYQQYKLKILKQERVKIQNLDNYSVYADYIFKSKQMIKELDEIKTKFRNRGQWSALVSAVKQKKDIYDSVIKLGQEFGFIEKKAAELKVEGEVSFSTMSDTEVKKQIREEVNRMNEIASGNIVEMRKELTGVTDDNISSFVPSNLLTMPKQENRKTKTKVKVTLKRRI